MPSIGKHVPKGVVAQMPLGFLGHRFPKDLDGPDAKQVERAPLS